MHIAAPSSVGGLETVLHTLAAGHAGRGHHVRVLAVLEPPATDHPFVDSLRAAGVDAVALEIRTRAYLSEIRQVSAIIRSFRPDVIHTHGSRSDLLHFPAARLCGIPIVTTLHGSSRPGGLAGLSESVQSWSLRWFDGVIGVSRALVHETASRGVPARRIHHIPNGAPIVEQGFTRDEARRRLGIGEHEQVVGWVGRLIPVKGADLFLMALAEARESSWKAVVIGNGPELPRLKQMAAALGIDQRVRFAGEVAAAGSYQSAFDRFVLSSRSEGLPMVLLEALVALTPVVAFPVGGVADLLSENEAFLAEPGDPVDLARALRRALADPDSARARATAAKERLDSRFGTEHWLDLHETLYARLARRVAARGERSEVVSS